MPDSSSGGFDDRLSRVNAKQLRLFDQQLQLLRSQYNAMSKGDRTLFRAWRERVVSADDSWKRRGTIRVMIQAAECVQDQEGHVSGAYASMTPQILLKAVRAWEQGEDFAPSNCFDVL